MKPANNSQLEIVKDVFSCYNKLVKLEQDDFLERLLIVMKRHKDYKSFDRGNDDFRDFAVKAYLYNLKNKYQEWDEMIKAVISTRDIIDDF